MSETRLAEIAKAHGTTVQDVIEDFGEMTYSLTEATFIGEMAADLGIAGGQELIDDSAEVLADAALFIGVDIDQLLPPETGAPAAVVRRAATYLRTGAATVAKKVAASPKGIIAAVVAIGLTSATALWLTEDLIVRMAKVDAKKEITSKAIAKAQPAQLEPVLENLTKPPSLFGQVPWWGWALGAAAAGLFAWRYYKRS